MPESSPSSNDLDLSTIDSRDKAEALLRSGALEKMYLRPPEFGGPDELINTLLVPASAALQKQRIDLEVIAALIEDGKITQYTVAPEYQGTSVIPTSLTITVSEPETYRFVINIWGQALERESAQWDEVYNAREAAYAQHFGPITGDVQKLMNLTGIWPGGCLVQIEAPRLGLWITSSFGLTNADMPATTRHEEFETQTTEEGSTQYQMQLVGRPPRAIPAGRAGYGYEILLLTRTQEFWPLMFLNWAVPTEILNDVDLLSRVHKYGAITIESIAIDEDQSADFLIAPLKCFGPGALTLPNGQMELLAATMITREEMEFGKSQGGPALLKRIEARAGGQISS